jgi:hypothetical protein
MGVRRHSSGKEIQDPLVDDLLTVRNPCSREKIEPCFRPIVEVALTVYAEILGALVQETRLMGSVARGDAQVPFSDIDFIALLSDEPMAGQAEAIARRATELTGQFSCVSKVDLEAVALGALGEARRFILNSDSVHLWGEDLFPLREQHVSGKKLADLLTPNLGGVLKGRLEAVRELSESDHAMLVQWSRWSGKDILKSLREHALLAGGTYERTVQGIRDQLRFYMSEHTPLIDDLYELYVRPEPNRGRILSVLSRAEAELPGT